MTSPGNLPVTANVAVDVDALRDVLRFVTDNPDRWDQSYWLTLTHDVLTGTATPGADWTCGTTACVAGWVALRAGWEPDVIRYPDGDYRFNPEVVRDPATEQRIAVSEAARVRLRISRTAADLLFHCDNSLRDLWEYAHAFTGGAIEVPADVLRSRPETFTFDPDDELLHAALAELGVDLAVLRGAS